MTNLSTSPEVWVSIDGFEKYLISNYGNIVSIRASRNEPKEKKQRISENGYSVAVLSEKGSEKSKYVHRLVADAFIKKIEGKPFVNHKDSDRLNNHVDNLEWCTQKENIRHAIAKGRMPQLFENNHKRGSATIRWNAKLEIEQVEIIRSSNLPSDIICHMFDISRNHVNKIRRGDQWKDLKPAL